MQFKEWSGYARQYQTIEVTIDRQANVLLLDPTQYARFKANQSYNYRGGWYTQSPATFTVPFHGWWYIIVYPVTPLSVNASVRVF